MPYHQGLLSQRRQPAGLGGLLDNWRYYAGPHLSQGIDNLGDAAGALLNFLGPQADIQGMYQDAGDAMRALRRGDNSDALASGLLSAAAIPMMAIPGTVKGIKMAVMPPKVPVDHFGEKIKSFVDRATSRSPKYLERDGIFHNQIGQQKRDAINAWSGGLLGEGPVVHRLGADRIRKVLMDHAKDKTPLTRKDITLLSKISTDGKVISVAPSRDKTARLSVTSRILAEDGNWLYVVEDLRKNTLDFTTAYKKPGPLRRPR